MTELTSTTNPKFKYLEGTKAREFIIGNVIWFNDFHTSNLKRIEYDYKEDRIVVTATTLNSVYVFTRLHKDKK